MWWQVKEARKKKRSYVDHHAKLKSQQGDVWQEKPK